MSLIDQVGAQSTTSVGDNKKQNEVTLFHDPNDEISKKWSFLKEFAENLNQGVTATEFNKQIGTPSQQNSASPTSTPQKSENFSNVKNENLEIPAAQNQNIAKSATKSQNDGMSIIKEQSEGDYTNPTPYNNSYMVSNTPILSQSKFKSSTKKGIIDIVKDIGMLHSIISYIFYL